MAHYAMVKDGIVQNVIVIEDADVEKFRSNTPCLLIKTSYNTHGGIHYDPKTGKPSADQSKALRKNYAGNGMLYDSVSDAFYLPQPFPSWTLNEETFLWVAPVAFPELEENQDAAWNEEEQKWDIITGVD